MMDHLQDPSLPQAMFWSKNKSVDNPIPYSRLNFVTSLSL